LLRTTPSLSLKRPQLLLTGLAAVGSIVLLLAATSVYGIGVSSDSAYYIAAAQSFARGKGFLDYSGNPYIYWPPLYPILIGTIYRLTNIPVMTITLAVNALALGGVIFTTAVLLKRCFPENDRWWYFGMLASWFYLGYYSLAANIATDLLYILLQLVFCLVGQNLLERNQKSGVFYLSLLAVFGSLLRWVGLALVVAEGLFILIAFRHEFKRAVIYSLFGCGAAAIPALAWLFGRNYLFYGTLFGTEKPQYISVIQNLNFSLDRITQWFIPLPAIRVIDPRLIIGCVLVVLLLINRIDNWKRWGQRVLNIQVLAVILPVLVYFLPMIVTAVTGDHYETFDDRYQAPMFLAILVGIFVTLDELVLVHFRDRWQKNALLAFTCLYLIWLIYPIRGVFEFTLQSRQNGVIYHNAYNTRAMWEMPLVSNLKSLDQSLPVYSNYSEAIFLFTDREVKPSPSDQHNYRANPDNLPKQYPHWPPDGRAYLVWLNMRDNPAYFNPDELGTIARLDRLYKGRDGQIFLVTLGTP
jgi:hypothetical protein